MSNNYYVASIGGYLHDIGKIITNYLYDNRDFRTYVERGRGVKSHRHAKVGSLLLSDYGLPKPIVDIVEEHHESIVDSIVEIVQWADRFDASYRAGTARDRGRKLPIEIAAETGLDVTKTLHGIDLGDYVKNFLRHIGNIIKGSPRLAALLIDGFYREATIHLRSDSIGDENISLYAHSKIVAALTSLKIRYPYSSPALVIIEPAIEERAQFMTVDVVEYLAGLHLYVYFGVLGAVSSMLNDLKLEPSFHIASETSSRFVVILGREHVTTLMDYLKKLATDLDIPIHIESYVMEKGILKKDIEAKIEPEPISFPIASQLICDICHQPIRNRELMLTLRRASKTLRLCERCSIIMHAYKILAGSKGVLCIKKVKNGLLKYLRLGLAVTICNPFRDDDYITARIIGFQGKDLEGAVTLIPSIGIYLNRFRKEYKYLAGISFKRLLDKLIKESKLHKYVSTVNILNKYMTYVIEHAKQSAKIYPLEILDDRVIFEMISPFDTNPIISVLLSSKLREHTAIAMVHRGSPGTTYKRLRYMLQKITGTDNMIAMESLDNALSLKDIFAFKELAQLLNVSYTMLYKRLVKLLEVLNEYVDSFRHGDEIERAYLKSTILSRLLEPVSVDEIEGLEAYGLLPFLEIGGQEELVAEKDDFKGKVSRFFNEEDNVRRVISVVSFLNRIGEVILHE